MKNILSLLVVVVLINPYYAFDQFGTDKRNIFAKVAHCAAVDVDEIDFDSCLMKGSMAAISMNSSTNSNRIDANFATKCEQPVIDEAVVKQIFTQTQAICFSNGIEYNHEDIDTYTTATINILSEERCWESSCHEIEGSVKNVSDTLSKIFKGIAVDAIGQCSGATIDKNSCTANTALDIIFTQVTLESSIQPNRHILDKSFSLSNFISFLDFDNSICIPPDIELSTIQRIVETAEQSCDDTTNHQDIFDVSFAIYKLFSAESCWLSKCNEIEKGVKEVVRAVHPIITRVLSQTKNNCTGVELDPNSCITSTALDMVIYQSAADKMTSIDDSLFYQDNSLSSLGNMCSLPRIDLDGIHDIVKLAEQICISNGVEIINESTSDISSAINKLLSTESCWNYHCNNVENEIEDFLRKTIEVKEISLNYIFECASLEFASDSCLETSIVDSILSGRPVVSNTKEERKLAKNAISFVDEFGNEIKAEKSFAQKAQCPITYFNSNEIDSLISSSSNTCKKRGKMISSKEEKDAETKLHVLFGAEQCWESICQSDSFLTLSSNLLEECLDIDLPVSITNPGKTFNDPKKYLEDGNLACMVDYAMKVDRFDYNLDMEYESKTLQCLPPGYKDMANICTSVIGPEALSQCLRPGQPFFDGRFSPSGDLSFSFDFDASMPFSYDFSHDYSYDFSYPFSNSYSYSFSFDYEENNKFHRNLIQGMCEILEIMSTEEGQSCLLPLCDLFDSEIGWFEPRLNEEGTPTANPTMDPTAYPSIQPSSSTSLQPSTAPSKHPSIHPSIHPSSSPTLQSSATPSIKPSSYPSSQPSIHPSSYPSLRPSATPSIQLTQNPSMDPSSISSVTPTVKLSSHPSTSPSIIPSIGDIEIRFEAEITLDIDIEEVPTEAAELTIMIGVLATAINKFLPNGAEARILRIGGVAVSRRRMRYLQEGLQVEFEVIMKKKCETASCDESTDIVSSMVNDATTSFQIAATSGSLTTAIQTEASKENVIVLQTVTVEEDSFVSKEISVKVETYNIGNDDDDDSSAFIFKANSFFIVIAQVLLLFNVLR